MNLSLMGLSPENAKLAERLFPDFDARDTGANQIEALMNAAREEGREEAWAEDDYTPPPPPPPALDPKTPEGLAAWRHRLGVLPVGFSPMRDHDGSGAPVIVWTASGYTHAQLHADGKWRDRFDGGQEIEPFAFKPL